MARYINVALPLPLRKLFTYLAPEGTEPLRGARVIVPFGTAVYTGIIVEVDVPPHPEAKPVIELLDERTPALPPTILELTRWVADYYLCSWGEALAAALPRELAPQSVVRVRVVRPPSVEELEAMRRRAPKRAQLLELLISQSKPLSVSYLQRQLQTESVAAQLDALEQAGYIEVTTTLEQQPKPRTERHVRLSPQLAANPELLAATLRELEQRAPKQARALATVADATAAMPLVPAREVLQHAGVDASALKALEAKGYITTIALERSPYEDGEHFSLAPTTNELELPLNDEQAYATARIIEALEEERTKVFLLHGVTGSGKTLVYMHAIRHALDRSKTALVLVPEISLTPQLIDRFTKAFGNVVVAFHSRMSASERFAAWRAIRQGQARIVLGPRSAVFTPLEHVGIIIVDEEHDSSYKQEAPAPRYNGRDTTIVRGHLEHAVVVLGSATPSLESMYNAATARYHLLELTSRADGAELPRITVVDLRSERRNGTLRGRFSAQLLEAICERLDRREGIILLHNRRGFAPRLECPECGYVPQCADCNVALTYHKRSAQLRCHYCGRSYAVPDHCPRCGNPTMEAIGAGTQRIEEELDTLLKQHARRAVITRVDTDATAAKGSLRRILHDFARGRIDILVGTQMIAKGLDIGRVTLVGVLNADMLLYLPDFRAAERTFQLLTQVAGRAGRRADKRGDVIIQTTHPDHPAIACTRLYRYDLFYNDELQERRQAHYPPFCRLVLVEFSGTDPELTERHAHAFAHYMPRGVEAITTLGPAKPSIDRIRGKYRYVVLVKGDRQLDPNGSELRRALLTALAAYSERVGSSSVRVTIDVDTYASL